MFLLHPPIAPWCVADASGLQLVLLASLPLPPGRVFVRTLPDSEEELIPMHADGQQGALHRWRVRVPWDRGNALTLYAFVAATPQGQRWLGADGEREHVPPEAQHFRVHPDEQPPAWVREQVFYQVFPARFAPGVHGGDLVGLADRLPYVQDELGATAIYLDPVFTAIGSRRDDIGDGTQVDPHLGGNAGLADLRVALHRRGMRLVLDAVVNHAGDDALWSDRSGHHDGRGVQPVISAAPDAVLRRWLRPPHAVDGWRLDVIHMLGDGPGARNSARHVRAVRRAVREENPEAYVLGEHFSEATRWLQGDQEDGAMNHHGFTQPLHAWLMGLELAGLRVPIDTAAFEAWLAQAIAAIPYANQLAQMNRLDSHDTPRLLTELGGDVERMKLAVTLLFTRPGVPCIHSGDETGLEGEADPDGRRCFDWDRRRWTMDLWTHYRQLALTRHRRVEWRHGATVTLATGDEWLAYARFTDNSATVVAVNRGPATRVALPLDRLPLPPVRWQEADGTAVTMGAGGMELALPARGSALVFSA